jgi:hypothetical protein
MLITKHGIQFKLFKDGGSTAKVKQRRSIRKDDHE